MRDVGRDEGRVGAEAEDGVAERREVEGVAAEVRAREASGPEEAGGAPDRHDGGTHRPGRPPIRGSVTGVTRKDPMGRGPIGRQGRRGPTNAASRSGGNGSATPVSAWMKKGAEMGHHDHRQGCLMHRNLFVYQIEPNVK